MHSFGADAEHWLVETLLAIRESVLDALIWFSDLCLEFFNWLSQVRSSHHPFTSICRVHDMMPRLDLWASFGVAESVVMNVRPRQGFPALLTPSIRFAEPSSRRCQEG